MIRAAQRAHVVVHYRPVDYYFTRAPRVYKYLQCTRTYAFIFSSRSSVSVTLQIVTHAISAGSAGHIRYELSAETFNPDAQPSRRVVLRWKRNGFDLSLPRPTNNSFCLCERPKLRPLNAHSNNHNHNNTIRNTVVRRGRVIIYTNKLIFFSNSVRPNRVTSSS